MPLPSAVPWMEWIRYLKSIPSCAFPSIAPDAGRCEPSVASVLWQTVQVVMSPVRLLPWRLRLKWQALHLLMSTTSRRAFGELSVMANAFEALFIGMVVTGSVASRRSVVDIAKCNVCHFKLSLHGNNRTGDVTTCTICHNTEATDGSKRAGAPTPYLDGKNQEGIDFKYLIHSIHGTALGNGIVVYGYNSLNAATGGAPGLPNDFRDVTFPQVASNCQACHVAATSSTYLQPSSAANGTSTDALDGTSGGVANLRTTKYAATCGACHGTPTMTSHIQQMGGAWDVTQAQIDAVNQ